jgi:amino acid transporter
MGGLPGGIESLDSVAHTLRTFPESMTGIPGDPHMTSKSIRTLFVSAAAFNWLVGLALLFDARLLFGLFRVTPLPTEPLFVQLFAWLVIVFGVSYFWVSRDPQSNAPLIKLGMLGKASVVLVCLAAVVSGDVSWQMMILASADLVYALIFWRALRSLR